MRIRFEMSFILKISTKFKSPTERTESTEIFFSRFLECTKVASAPKRTQSRPSLPFGHLPLYGEKEPSGKFLH